METRVQIRNQLFFVVKLLGAIVILYCGLTWKVTDVGEKLTSYYFGQYGENDVQQQSFGMTYMGTNTGALTTGERVELYISDAVAEMLSGSHHVSDIFGQEEYTDRFQAICMTHLRLCLKISFAGTVMPKNRYLYLASIVHIGRFFRDSLTIGHDFYDTLDKITIYADGGTRRGNADWDSINIYVDHIDHTAEFFEIVTHELAHVVDLGVVQGVGRTKHVGFTEFGKKQFALDDPSLVYYGLSRESEKVRKSSARASDFCSGYGMTNPFEDLAECMNLYINHQSLFRYLAKRNDALQQKYNFIATWFDGGYLFKNSQDLALVQEDDSYRAWDTTRIN